MIGGTSGSDTKLCQPSASQSKMTHTRLASLGSRNTCAPLEPCWRRLSAPLVEKIRSKRSKSSTVVVARNICAPLVNARRRDSAPMPNESIRRDPGPAHRANALLRVYELLLEGPQRCGRAAAPPGLLVDVLDVVPGGLPRDPESVADGLV